MQAVRLGETAWIIYGAWSIYKKLIQNTPNFGLWTGTLKRAYFAVERRRILLFMYSKLIISGRYIMDITPCVLKLARNMSTPPPHGVSFQNQVLTWRSLQRISEQKMLCSKDAVTSISSIKHLSTDFLMKI